MGGWIPVTERLPPEEIRVLAYDGQDVFESEHYGEGWEWTADVTHWAPLPEPPCCTDQTTPSGKTTPD